MKLSYICRGNASLQGKPKIYFSSHPDDFSKYFDQIKEILLKESNLSIWYDENLSADDDRQEIADQLHQMHLVVIPVTKKLLTQKNQTVSVEFPLAQKLHIPILPLMMEGGLDQLFEQQFGSIHYLIPEQTDETAVPFSEKLHKWMEEVLTTDSRTQEIRDIFRGGMFLSYRKADRYYARNLMNMIHKNESLQDVAVWYDEFLLAGENYNQNIENSLIGNKAFILAVTPNLLAEGNYVQRIEYPMAVSEHKKIIAVEMAETNKTKLSRLYPDIGNVISFDDPDTIRKHIEDCFAGCPPKQNCSDIHKKFLLGLAYMNGINVELDREKGFALIEEAAKNGDIEAIKELIILYRDGKGVDRSLQSSFTWRIKLVDKLENQYRTKPDADLFNELFSQTFELAQNFQRDGNIRYAGMYYKKLYQFAQSGIYTDNIEKMLIYSKVQLALGDMEAEKGNNENAISLYRDTLKLRKQMIEQYSGEKNIPFLRRHLSVPYLKLGDLELRLGYFDTALELYKNCYRLRYAAYKELKSGDFKEYEARRDYAVILMRLGELFDNAAHRTAQNNGDSSEEVNTAMTYYTESLKERQALYDELRNAPAMRDLSLAYARIGKLALDCNNQDVAAENFNQMLTIIRQLADKSDSIQDRRDLANALLLYSRTQGLPFKLLSVQEGREIMEQLAKQTMSYIDRNTVAQFYVETGESYLNMDILHLTAQWYYKAHQIYLSLYKEFGNLSDSYQKACYGDIALSFFRMGTFARKNANYLCLQDALHAFSDLKQLYPDDSNFIHNYELCKKLLENFHEDSPDDTE